MLFCFKYCQICVFLRIICQSCFGARWSTVASHLGSGLLVLDMLNDLGKENDVLGQISPILGWFLEHVCQSFLLELAGALLLQT